MDICICNSNEVMNKLLPLLVGMYDISIHFSYDESEFVELFRQVEPDIIFVNERFDISLFNNTRHRCRVYILPDNEDSSDTGLMEQVSQVYETIQQIRKEQS